MKKASLMGAFFVSVVLSLQAQALCPAAQGLPQVTVAKVIDGDTLRLVDGQSVRLIGLNTTEIAHKGRQAEPFSRIAKARLQELVSANGDRIGLRAGRQGHDHYGRVLAHAFDAQGRSLEARMLADGMGFHVAIDPNVSMTRCLQAAEHRARVAGKGVWQRSPVVPVSSLRHGGFALVRARVERLETNRGGIWLELQGPLVLQIPREAVGAFGARLQSLPGNEIEARGWVIDRKGRRESTRQARWLMQISHPSMLAPLP